MSPINGKYDCAEVLALLSLSLDDELSPLESHKLERHLADCPDCRRRGAGIEAITRTLRAMPLEARPVSSLPRLPWRRRVARTGIPVAAAMIAASLGLVALQGSADMGPGGIRPAVTVSSAPHFSPVTHSLPPQLRPEYVSALVWLP
ncbi:MAG: zf-HC2 domain-containing protein [Gaiellaceae bacterium]